MVFGCDQVTTVGKRWESIDQFGWKINVISSASELLKEFQKKRRIQKAGVETILVADRACGIVTKLFRMD